MQRVLGGTVGAFASARRKAKNAAEDLSSENALPLQRSMFPWVEYMDEREENKENNKSYDTTDVWEVASRYGIPKVLFEMHLQKQMDASANFHSLPFTILLVMSYAGMMIIHMNTTSAFSVENAMVTNIEQVPRFGYTSNGVGHKTVYDVNSAADMWSWMQRGFVPWVLSNEPVGTLLHFNKVVGGFRLRQERSDLELNENGYYGCETALELTSFWHRTCVLGYEYEHKPDIITARTTSSPRREVWIYVNDDAQTLDEQLVRLELEEWYDNYTQKVELGVPVYNAEHGVHTLININFFYPRSGRVWKIIIPASVFGNPYAGGTLAYTFDLVWATCIGYIFFVEIVEIRSIIKEHTWRGIYTEYVGLWNLVDWISVLTGIVIITIFLLNLGGVYGMNNALATLSDLSWNESRAECEVQTSNYIDELTRAVSRHQTTKVLFSVYPAIIGLRLLKAFAAQDRLSIVTTTILTAGISLLHLGVIFGSVFSMFVVSGILLYGRDADDYASIMDACTSCFRLMLGDRGWDQLRLSGMAEAGGWYVLFMSTTNFLLFNIILATILDVYVDVKMKAGGTTNVLTDMVRMYKNWVATKRGECLPLKDVYSVVKAEKNVDANAAGEEAPAPRVALVHMDGRIVELNMGVDFMVTATYLKENINQMRSKQALDLIVEAIKVFYSENKEDVHMSDLSQMLREMNYLVKMGRKTVCLAMNKDHRIESSHSRGENSAIAEAQYQATKNAKADFLHEMFEIKRDLQQARLWINSDGRPIIDEPPPVLSGAFEVKEGQAQEKRIARHDIIKQHVDQQTTEAERLDEELAMGQTVAQESEETVKELETRLLQVSEDGARAVARRHRLRQQVLLLAKVKKRTKEAATRAKLQMGPVQASQKECFKLYETFTHENAMLRANIDELEQETKSIDQQRVEDEKRLTEEIEDLQDNYKELRIRINDAASIKLRWYPQILDRVESVYSTLQPRSPKDPENELLNLCELARERFSQRLNEQASQPL